MRGTVMQHLRSHDSAVSDLMVRYPRLFRGMPPRSVSWIEPGWLGIVDELCRGIDALLDDEQARSFTFKQIKEKVGGLRVYFNLPGASYPQARGIDGDGWSVVNSARRSAYSD